MAAMLTGPRGKEKHFLADFGVQSVHKKNMFWNLLKRPAVLCYILIDKQMLKKGVLLKCRFGT